jgi:hypothetical protein
MTRQWLHAWSQLPQEHIHSWIQGVIANIQRVIELEGGNEYVEGRQSKRSYAGIRRVGYLSDNSYYTIGTSDAGTMSIGAILNDDEEEDGWEGDGDEGD